MRFAIFSDVHANLEALEAVLADARARKCTRFVCLGDVVGYNANPGECVERVRELDCPVVKGNHDEAASRLTPPGDFNEIAERAIAWTRERLTDGRIAAANACARFHHRARHARYAGAMGICF